MNLQQIRAKYKELHGGAEPGTFKLGAYYNILTCLTSRPDKQAAKSAIRTLLKHIGPEYRQVYLDAIRDLETKGKEA